MRESLIDLLSFTVSDTWHGLNIWCSRWLYWDIWDCTL